MQKYCTKYLQIESNTILRLYIRAMWDLSQEFKEVSTYKNHINRKNTPLLFLFMWKHHLTKFSTFS